VNPTVGILGEQHTPRVVRDTGCLDATEELSREWQSAILARKGELDDIEERFDRQIVANREASFRIPDMPANVLLQPEPNLIEI